MSDRSSARAIDAVVVAAMAAAAALVLPLAAPAWGWFAGARARPTALQQRNNGVDPSTSTHQWAAAQAFAILDADGRRDITAFLRRPDPSAPEARDPASGVSLGRPEPYRWRILAGAKDADGALYPQLRDHLHNFWTHRGRQWVVGESAASNAEKSFGRAVALWRSGDKAQSLYWLGASLHLVQDACVPQHNFFGVGVYHREYEQWVLTHQDQLVVGSGGIYRGDFRQQRGHGGPAWSSAHPRGWADECAHRGARQLRNASHSLPKPSGPSDPQWATRDHIAALQRLSAGYIAFFFEEVHGP